MRLRNKIILYSLLGLTLLVLLIASQVVCLSAWFSYGVRVPVCPDGEIRQGVTVDTSSLRRGTWGSVTVGAQAYYTTGRADMAASAAIRRLDARVLLVAGDKETPLEPKKDWKDLGWAKQAHVKLPADLPDGDYVLRAHVSTPVGESSLDVPLRVYAPAKVHVLTDRPLYEPGNTVMFRAVVLRAKDLAPLDRRPGKWFVTDPNGETVLEERAPAGDFGVVAGTFPLDSEATTGDWRVRWQSGSAKDEITFRVEPFTLPRFRVEVSTSKPFYKSGQRPVLRGQVIYSSGAPVADATVELRWSVAGAWPVPSEWMAGGLPKATVSDKDGRFELKLPQVPGDLRGRATLVSRIAAIDPAGDRVESTASILLSEDAIQVASELEFPDGIVQGFNNRVYLRAATAAGTVLANTDLVVKRAWEPTDKGVAAKTDADGVASLQLDPGPPVNVVVPPMPVRPPPKQQAIVRGQVMELISERSPSLAEQVAMDSWNRRLAPCARFVNGSSDNVSLGIRVSAQGAITAVSTTGGLLARCMKGTLETLKVTPGGERLFQAQFGVNSDLPSLSFNVSGALGAPEGFEASVQRAALDARKCLPEDVQEGSLPRVLLYRLPKGGKKPSVSFASDPQAEPPYVSSAVARCVEAQLARLEPLDQQEEEGEKEDRDFVGLVRFTVEPAPRVRAVRPQATTMLGYELKVIARSGKEEIGETKLFLRPGTIPAIRLRASPVLGKAGEKVNVVILRGPNFRGKLPKKLHLYHDRGSIEAELDQKTRSAEFALPADAQGWFEARWSGARTLVYVRSKADLTVAVQPDKEKYAPGETAQIGVLTKIGGKAQPAAVGLFGVDQSLGQIATLAGPDDMARVREKATMSAPAFGVLDIEALAMGRIRGENASAAMILRVTKIPTRADIDTYVSANGRTTFEPLEALTDHFYTVLGELHAQVRGWEKEAPKQEQMQPATMARLWKRALTSCKKRGEDVTDAYGRELRLSRLPNDLLALTEPRAVVITGTRLPEDVENWQSWVRKELP